MQTGPETLDENACKYQSGSGMVRNPGLFPVSFALFPASTQSVYTHIAAIFNSFGAVRSRS